MYKLIGAMAVMISFIMYGLAKCGAVKKRLKFLKEFRNMINALRTEISFKATPLPRAVQMIGERFSNECFKDFSENIGMLGGQKAFEEALNRFSSKYFFTAHDKSCILLMAEGLGRTDIENQVRQLDHAICELDKIISEATAETSDKTRGYLNGSVLIGAFAVLMLM